MVVGFGCAAPAGSLYSWTGAVHTLAQVPKQARVQKTVFIDRKSRWQLAQNSKIFLQSPLDVPIAWLESAQAGLSSQFVFTTSRQDADYELEIGWPAIAQAAQPNHQMQADVGLLSVNELPTIKQRASIKVRISSRDRSFHETVSLLISPAWLGQAWHHPQNLQRSFDTLAQQLSSG